MPICIFAATLSALHQEYGESPRLGNGELTRREDPVTSDTGARPFFAPASKQDAERESTMSGPVAASGKGPELVEENISKEKQMESSNMKR